MIVDQLFEGDDKKKKLNEVDPQNFDSDEDYYDAVEADDLDLDKFGNGWDIPDEIAVLRNQLRHTTSQYARDQIENKIKRYEDIYYGEDDLEEDAPVADLTTSTTNQTYTPPSRGFGVMIKLNMPDSRLREAAKEVWEALETILPRDYPRVPFQQQSGNEPQVRVIEDLRNDGFSIVKQQIGSQDIAQTIANKFEGRSIPAEVIDSGIFEEYDPAQSSKFISAATKAAKIMFDFERGYNQAFRAELENQYGFDPDTPGIEVSPHNATQLIKWLSSKGCTLSFNKKEPIEFALTMPGQNQPYEFNILDMIQGGELEEGNKFFQQHGIGVQNGKFPEPRKPHFPGDQGSKSETLGKDGLIYHWQDPRARQGMGEDLNRRGFLQGLGMAAAGAAGLGAAGAAQARATPDWMEKVKRAKALMAKGQSREQTARIMGIKGPNPGGAGPMSGDWGAVNYAAQEMRVKESTTPKQRKLNEAMLMEDPVYRKFKTVGRYIAERKMTEKEILDVFAAAEQGMTDAGTGANRTMLGRGKDTATKFAGDVSGAVKGVLNSIQNSVPVAAVDVAYDQATDALANVAGGQSGPVMNAIKKYRMLAKEYPKTAGFAKAALVAIAGLATGGAGLPAIAGLTYALDSAIKGDKLSSVLGKGAGAAALSAAGQAVHGAMNQNAFDTGQMPDADSLAPGEEIVPSDVVPSRFDAIVDNAVDYKVKQGDTLSDILADRKINPEAFKRLPGNDVFFGPDGNPNLIKAGQSIKLPDPADVADLNKMSWTTPSDPSLAKDFGNPDFYTGQYNQNSTSGLDAANNLKQQELGRWGSDNGMSAARAAKDAGGGMDMGGSSDLPSNPSAASDYGMGGNAPIDYSQPGPITTDSLGQKLEYGMPVSDNGSFIPPNPNLPAQELATQQAAYDAWKADFMRRFPNATQAADGSMQGIKPGLAPMYPTNYTPGMNTNGLTPKAVQESVKIKKLSFDKLVDQKSTVMNWALSESVGRKSKSVNLTTVGTYTVFENVDRYRKALLEYAETQPGRPELPDLYRPDMPDAPMQPADPAKKSWLGKGIDYLDKGVKKVGSALSNFGHQFTTNVTKEKLKMNWHQAGKPSDSDALAAWLVKQGVPQDVVTNVYSSMGIPYTAPATPAPAPATPAAKPVGGAAQKQMAFYGTNPATKKPWTYDELQAKATAGQAAPTAPAATTTTAANPAGFNAGNVMKLPGMEKYATKPAPAKAPNFAQQGGGYAKVNQPTTVSYSTGTKPAAVPAVAPTAASPAGTRVVSGGPTPDEQAKLAQRIAQAAKQPVAEMLSMVETKEDVAKIKKFVDQTFVKYGAVSESAFVVRNKLIEHITQVGAQRRREFARKS